MDSRSFAIGLIFGVVIGALTVWSIGGSGGDEVLPVVEPEDNTTSIPELEPVVPPVERKPQELPSEKKQEGGNSKSPIDTTVDPVVPWPEHQRAELKLEPKDDSWAYYMEQTLLQFLSTHPSIDQFELSYIECRTTICQIEVFGFDESTVPVWQQVMYDINQQPWSEFGQYSSGSGDSDGRLTILAKLQREFDPQ